MGRWATVLLAIFLIALGMTMVLNLHFDYQNLIMGALAIAAGILILVGK